MLKISSHRTSNWSPETIFNLTKNLQAVESKINKVDLSNQLAINYNKISSHFLKSANVNYQNGKTTGENIQSTALSPNGEILLIGKGNGKIEIASPHYPFEIKLTVAHKSNPLKKSKNPIHSLAFSPNGQLFASCGNDGHIYLWHLLNNQCKEVSRLKTDSISLCLTFLSDQLLVCGNKAGLIEFFEIDQNFKLKKKAVLQAHTSLGIKDEDGKDRSCWIRDITLLNSSQLASGAHDGLIKIWDIDSRKLVKKLEPYLSYDGAYNANRIRKLTLMPNGYLASCTDGGIVRIWDVNKGILHKTVLRYNASLNQYTPGIVSMAALPDNNLVIGDAKNIISILRTEDNNNNEDPRIYKNNQLHSNEIRGLVVHPLGKFIISGCRGGKLSYLKLPTRHLELGDIKPLLLKIKDNKFIQKLCLKEVDIKEEQIKGIAQLLRDNFTLKDIELKNKKFTALLSNCSLENLSEQAEQINKLRKYNKEKINSLNLSKQTHLLDQFKLETIQQRDRQCAVANSNLQFIRHDVSGDGECGYTAFGITREKAYDLIREKLVQVSDLLKPVVEQQLLTEAFIEYLKPFASSALKQAFAAYQQAAQKGGEMSQLIIDNLKRQANDLSVIQSYIDYDIRDKKVDAGWAHPCVLQAVAHIQGIRIRLWQPNSQGKIIPHIYYPVYGSTQAPETNLLFVNNNHFERLDEMNQAAKQKTPLHGHALKFSSFPPDNKLQAAIKIQARFFAKKQREALLKDRIKEITKTASMLKSMISSYQAEHKIEETQELTQLYQNVTMAIHKKQWHTAMQLIRRKEEKELNIAQLKLRY